MYQNISFTKGINKILFSKGDSFADIILSCQRIKLTNSHTLNFDGVSQSNFTEHLRRKNASVPGNYFTLFDAAGVSATLVPNQNATTKENGNCFPSEIQASNAAKTVLTKCCCLWICPKHSDSWQATSIVGEIIFTFKSFLYTIYSRHAYI